MQTVITVLFAALLHGLGTHCLTTSPYYSSPRGVEENVAVPDGFVKRLFFDDFSGQPAGSLPSPSKWQLDLGTSYPGGPEHWGTGEVQTYTNSRRNIEITARNTLQITPQRSRNGSWTSARIETTAPWDFACQRGHRLRVEARLKLGDGPMSKQLGIWPAFWALGSDYRGDYWNWPSVGEIDILESVNGESKAWHVVHCGVAPGGPCKEFSGISNVTDHVQRGVWHTLSWEIDRRREYLGESMSWFVDGRREWTLTESDVGDDDAWKALAGNKKMVLLNVAVGGSFPDAIAGFKTPTAKTVGGNEASLEVDYVAVYSSK